MPTRLLDWTLNPLAALYFAVSKNPGEDGEFFIMDAYQLSKDQQADTKHNFHGIATSGNQLFIDTLKIITKWKRTTPWIDFIMPIRPNHFDKRIAFQKACFTFHVPDCEALSNTHNSTLQSFRINKDDKENLQKELSLLSVDEFSIYGDLNSLATTLKRNYKIGR